MKSLLRFPVTLMAGMLLAGCHHVAHHPAASAYPFEESAAKLGVKFQHHSGGPKQALNIVQIEAGGCGMLDFDGDGYLDLYLVQGQHTPDGDAGNKLFRNRGDGTFEDVTQHAGVAGHGFGMGCGVGDYDGDGHPDLFVCNYGTSQLFHNQGDGTFRDVTTATGTGIKGCSLGAVFADLDGDGWPDLYVTRYVHIRPEDPLLCSTTGVPSPCGPDRYAAEPGVFLHNDHGRKFQDKTAADGLVDSGHGMSAAVADLDDSGHLSLFVANDTSANALFVRDRPGHFQDRALAAGVAYGDQGTAEANMGCDFGDYNEDGRLDLYVGVMQDRAKLLFRNEGKDLFTLASHEAGIAEATAPVVTFGCGFLDYDNDGDLDIFQSNGHVRDRIQEIDPAQRYAQPRQLLENVGGGHFVDRTSASGPAFLTPAVGRGCAFGDLRNNGATDILVNNIDGPGMLLVNQRLHADRHWLEVRLVGKAPNTSPEGTMAELTVGPRKLLRHLHTARSYASASDPRLHFGLGEATAAGPLHVRWTDGTRQEVTVPGLDRELVVRHP